FYQNTLNGSFGRGAPANAGGGGTAHNAGGGGGANGNNGLFWTGQGVMSLAVTGSAAWLLDPAAIANGDQLTTSAGGGRGGYTYAADDEDALSLAPGDTDWGGNLRRERGGLGGRPLENAVDGRLFLGGGGGAGDGNNNAAGAGGNAGGLVVLITAALAGSGSVPANGNAGQNTSGTHNAGPGGGGGGGSIVIDAGLLSGVALSAVGGAGGN